MPRARILPRPWPFMRFYSTSRSTSGPSPLQRELFRRVAQPVAVLTAHLPSPTSPTSSAARAPREEEPLPLPDNHGATLSSLSSISLSPPLVSFSLRLPSRLAAFLSPETSPSPSEPKPTFRLHLLTPAQEPLARLFARQAPLPAPAAPSPATNWSEEPRFEPEVFRELETGGLGSMRCTLVQSVPLWELGGAGNAYEKREGEAMQPRSQLFIARVEEVRLAGESGESGEGSLVYWEQGYHGIGGGEAKR